MKKAIILFTCLCLLPLEIIAYSDKIIPGGENIGIEINSVGVTVIGFYKVNGRFLTSNLAVGDKIVAINDQKINSIQELVTVIEQVVDDDNTINISYVRGKKALNTSINLEYIDNSYKTGLYVKDATTGIGTLTYIDPSTHVYASLGHEIIENTTKERVDIRTGYIFKSYVTGITKSSDGYPGGKNAKFYKDNVYGNVLKNTSYGIYGIYKNNLPSKDQVTVGKKSEAKLGNAEIYTSLSKNSVNGYTINILEINETSKIKNFYFEITDQELLNKTGGIVQGMSGSPIIQNGKIIGAVTHVIIDDVTRGYGIFIETMLNEGDKVLN